MSSTVSENPRRSDTKLLVVTAVIVVLIGASIGGLLLFLSRGGKTGPCGTVNAGSLSDLLPRAKNAPSFVAAGGDCYYWLALRDGRLVAIKPTIASLDCTIDWKPATNKWTCSDRSVTFAQMDYYATSTGTGEFKGIWFIDFGDEPTTSATT